MALEPDQGTEMTPAAVQSPIMNQTSATCTLHFYYNMFGEGMFKINYKELLFRLWLSLGTEAAVNPHLCHKVIIWL